MSKEIDEWEDYEHYLNGKSLTVRLSKVFFRKTHHNYQRPYYTSKKLIINNSARFFFQDSFTILTGIFDINTVSLQHKINQQTKYFY